MANTKMLVAAIVVAAGTGSALKLWQHREAQMEEARTERLALRAQVRELEGRLMLLQARAEMAFQRQAATESLILTRRKRMELESMLDTATEEDVVEDDAVAAAP